jgi:BirA family biotin operon repressor/biotin-[acetyl-CoA-carboxylase] ligase
MPTSQRIHHIDPATAERPGAERTSLERAISERALLLRLAAGPVTGEALAQAGGQTRAAVWKRIDALRLAGIEIDARPGRGYALRHPLELLDPTVIRALLPPAACAQLADLEIAWSLDSTNSELLRRPPPAAGCRVLLAERQTGGRGRRGRVWASPLAAHLYLSLTRTFGGGLARLGGLSLVAGIAAAEALHAFGVPGVSLKWPNDLVVAHPAAGRNGGGGGLRKLGGLLVEGGGEAGGPVRAVVGLGLNVRMPAAIAAQIGQPWTDLATLSGRTPSRNALAAAVVARLLPALEAFDRDGLAPFLPRYAALDALAGRPVTVQLHDGERHGIALGIGPDGALRMRLDDGGECAFHAGEVSVRAVDAAGAEG